MGNIRAASVIDARFQELGGTPVEESLEHRAARLEKTVQFAKFREGYLASEVGVRQATASFEALIAEVVRRTPTLQASAPSLKIRSKQVQNILVLLSSGPALRVHWQQRYVNTLLESLLEASLWRGHPPFPGMMHFEKPQSIATLKFEPDVLPSEELCWTTPGGGERKSFLAGPAAEFILNWWLERAIKQQNALR